MILLAIVYICFIIKAICEPTQNLKVLTEKELNDHEYEKLSIEEYTYSDSTKEVKDSSLEDV